MEPNYPQRVVAACLVLGGLVAAPTRAQPGSPPASLPEQIAAGACAVVVTLAETPGGNTVVQIDLNKQMLHETPAGDTRTVTVELTGPLQERDVVRVRRVDTPPRLDSWDDTRTVAAGDGSTECEPPESEPAPADERDPFSASFYVGSAFDNFAPGSVGGYADNAEAGASRRRWVAGTDFEFHVAGAGARQLWLFGETVNGVRAADVDCAAENPAAVCGTLTDQPGDQFRYVLENASSKEALFGLRLELARLNADTDFATRFYVTGQLGVMMLTGSVIVDLAETGAPDMVEAQEAYSAHHVGAGLLIESGHFGGSYFEVGWGRTDLFSNFERLDDGTFVELNRWRRIKIDAHLSFPLSAGQSDRWPRPFLQLFADFDPTDKTADSIQTFIGVDFDLSQLFP